MSTSDTEAAPQALESTDRDAAATIHPASKPKKLCPECGGEVGPKTKGVAKIFCQAKCRSKFHARSKARGQVLVPLLLAWRVGRGSTETSKAAHAEMIQITDRFAQEDRAAGRPPIGDYVDKLLWMGRHVDRRRK